MINDAQAKKVISVSGAAQGPLNNVDLEIPLKGLTCFTGRCGAGSRVMAVEVLYAESRRRYMLALTPFERENLGSIGRGDGDHISGLPPAIFFESGGIKRKESLATFLQLEDLLGQLWYQQGICHCLECNGPCKSYSAAEAAAEVLSSFEDEQILVIAPLRWAKNTAPEKMVEELRRAGFTRVLLAGEIVRLDDPGSSTEAFLHAESLDVVIDRLVPSQSSKTRILEAISKARAMASGTSLLIGIQTARKLLLNKQLSCVNCGKSYPDLGPEDFMRASKGQHPLADFVELAGHRIKDLDGMTLDEVNAFIERFLGEGEQYFGGGRALQAALGLELGYLKFGSNTEELSSGEQQRLLLGSCLGSGLTGILYIFEAPMVGFQARERQTLLKGLRGLVSQGNTVVVLENAVQLREIADEVIEFAQGNIKRGENLGPVVTPQGMRQHPQEAASGNLVVQVEGAYNLKKIEVEFPLHCLVCLTGVSGAGKSVLLRQVLLPALQSGGQAPINKKRLVNVIGGEQIRRVVYLQPQVRGRGKLLLVEMGGAEVVAELFAGTSAASQRGYPREWFKLDVPGGRCVNCEGRGFLHYDLEFLEDISLSCPVCEGRRYRPEILEITFRGQNIHDVLEMTIEQASQHFLREPILKKMFDAATFCGLGQCKLGISSEHLEKVEYLWLRLAVELVRVRGTDLFILDNPSAGGHAEDLQLLLQILDALVGKGASVLVSEQHPDILSAADWLVEMGPGGGPQGGRVMATGHPRDFAERADLFPL